MGLPQINESSFTQETLLSGKKIGFKPWRVKEERELLYAIEGMDNQNDSRKEIVKFIRKCVDNQSTFDNLSPTDQVYLLTKLRRSSKGSTIEFKYPCDKCSFELIGNVSVVDNLIIKKFENKPIVVNKDLTITIKEVPFEDVDYLKENCTKLAEYNFEYLLRSIDSIAYKKIVYEDFNLDEIRNFVDELSSEDLKVISNKIEEASAEIKLEKEITCERCKTVNKVRFGDLYHFLAF